MARVRKPAKQTPWIQVTLDEEPQGFTEPPDINQSFRAFTDSFTYWLPTGMNKAAKAGKQMLKTAR